MKIRIIAILLTLSTLLLCIGCGANKEKNSRKTEKVSFPVKVEITPEEAAAKINNKTVGEVKKLKTETVRLSRYDSAWAFAHHAYITEFKGKLYAMWSSGRENEDDLGQRVMYSVSEDFFHWSIPKALVDTMNGISSENVLFPVGFFVDGDTLIASYKRCEYPYTDLRNDGTLRPSAGDAPFISTYYYYMKSDDGVNWSNAEKYFFRGTTHPRKNLVGRYVWAGGTSIYYADKTDGITGWVKAGIKPTDLEEAVKNGAANLCEASCYQTKDYVMHLLMRSNTGYLWDSESYDNGETWSQPYPTNFTDDNTMCYFDMLPDGRYFYVGSPCFSGSDARDNLMLCVSDDGYNFSKQFVLGDCDYEIKKGGYAKCGDYGYPECYVGKEYVYIIYSLGKEVMEVMRFKISDIDNKSTASPLENAGEPVFIWDCSDASAVTSTEKTGNTVISFDESEAALKITATGKDSPASATFNIGASSAFDTAQYPVIAFKVKRKDYDSINMGSVYFCTDKNPDKWVQFKSPKYSFHKKGESEYVTVAVDLSKVYNYYDSDYQNENYKAFKGNWKGVKLGFAYSQLLEKNADFFVKSVGIFKSVNDAYIYYLKGE